MIAFYVNFFVLVVKLFKHVPVLAAIAPTQTEPPFKVTQLIVLVVFVVIAISQALDSVMRSPTPLNRAPLNPAMLMLGQHNVELVEREKLAPQLVVKKLRH